MGSHEKVRRFYMPRETQKNTRPEQYNLIFNPNWPTNFPCCKKSFKMLLFRYLKIFSHFFMFAQHKQAMMMMKGAWIFEKLFNVNGEIYF